MGVMVIYIGDYPLLIKQIGDRRYQINSFGDDDERFSRLAIVDNRIIQLVDIDETKSSDHMRVHSGSIQRIHSVIFLGNTINN